MRVADTAPAYCSGCFQSKPAERHIDFDVAWDGPTITEAVTVAIDDLILCEDCLKAAAKLIGMADPAADQAELEQLRASNQHLVEKVRGLEDYAGRMEAAVAAKPEPERKSRQKAAA